MQFISSSSHLLREIPLIGWTNAAAMNMKDDIIQLLQLFDPKIEDVDIFTPAPRQTYVSLKHRELGHAPLNTFGDGLRRVFTLATSILGAKNGLLLVDELETAIHTHMLEKTFDWLVKSCMQNNVQLFATTHSLETVDAILGASDETVDLATYRLEEGENRTAVARFNVALLKRLREVLGLEIR